MYGHLTIRKCYNRKGLAKWFRDNLSNISLIKAFQMADSLPFSDSDFWFNDSNILKTLEDVAEYSWKEDIIDYSELGVEFNFPPVIPLPVPNEEKYLDAVNWYNTLNEDEQDKVDVLVSMIQPPPRIK